MSNIGRRASEGAYFLHNGTLFSPIGFMFAVDRRSVHLRSLRFLEANYRMCKYGVRVLPEGWSSYPAQNKPGDAPDLPGQNANGFGAKPFIYNPLIWGHVNERLPFHLFGHEFVERPVPDCIWEGDHATMNCSQPLVPRALPSPSGASNSEPLGHDLAHPHHHLNHTGNNERAVNLTHPTYVGGCTPFDNRCGSHG